MPLSKDIRFIGIDGGGTKTACMIGDGLGNVLAVCYGASSSIKSNSREVVQEVLLSLIQQVLALSNSTESQLEGVFLGLAGADRPEDKVQILSLLEGSCRIRLSLRCIMMRLLHYLPGHGERRGLC